MKKTGSEQVTPAEPLDRARLQADVAKQRVRIAKEELKRARKRLKEAKRESKRARKQAAAARKVWKRARRAQKDGSAAKATLANEGAAQPAEKIRRRGGAPRKRRRIRKAVKQTARAAPRPARRRAVVRSGRRRVRPTPSRSSRWAGTGQRAVAVRRRAPRRRIRAARVALSTTRRTHAVTTHTTVPPRAAPHPEAAASVRAPTPRRRKVRVPQADVRPAPEVAPVATLPEAAPAADGLESSDHAA